MTPSMQYLLSLPPAMARDFGTLEKRDDRWFAKADPAEAKLGSGGGVAHLLTEAWREKGGGASFNDWLGNSRNLILLAGGQSRRLPAYAALSKILLPFKVLHGFTGQRLDQTLLDVQLPAYERVLSHAPPGLLAMVTSGDVFLRFGKNLPPFPEVDILGLGMWVKPEVATDFGVFFSRRDKPEEVAFFLQKPPADRVTELSASYFYLVDTGMWLLSARAIKILLRHCGWNEEQQVYDTGCASNYELYAGLGLGLGTEPTRPDPEISQLKCSVVALPQAEFYHLGTSRQMIHAISALENKQWEQSPPSEKATRPHPDQHIQNAPFNLPLRRKENHTLWVENSTIGKSWTLDCEHVLTGVPENDWTLHLDKGVCLDFIPIGESDLCVRPYGMDDAFKGAIGSHETHWFGRPVPHWFSTRRFDLGTAGISANQDIQKCPLFVVLPKDKLDPRFIEWLFQEHPRDSEECRNLWIHSRRLSAELICAECNLTRVYAQRRENMRHVFGRMVKNERWNFFFQLDLEATASVYAEFASELPAPFKDEAQVESMDRIHDQMFRAAVLRARHSPDWPQYEARAFQTLRHLMIRQAEVSAVEPRPNIMEDQIIWGRSPVRLDLAGGWSDTPPYCIEYGGKVLNLAVDLNGQPPIQVFAKLSDEPELVLRSIDLGIERRIKTFEDLDSFQTPDGAFSLAKAALALAGFLPRFRAGKGFSTLREQLKSFGCGIEVSLLAAAPKGSGLGTSSILAATLLGVVSELCGLGWDQRVLFNRTLALEQMLTTGGGWQDQAGGIYRGIKLVETTAGLEQKPTLRWLPEHLFKEDQSRSRILLYYTGITRLAKNILQEIVRGMFLNSRRRLDVVDEIKEHAETAFQSIQTSDWDGLCHAVARSWTLNQRLDGGTNPPAVQAILSQISDHVAAHKLLGAGGGGYLLIFAKDDQAAH